MARLLLLLFLSASVSSCFLEYWGCGSDEELQRLNEAGDQYVSLEEPMQVGKGEVLVVSSATCDAYGFADVQHATVEPDIADWSIRQDNGFPELVLHPHTPGEARLTVVYRSGDDTRGLSTDLVVIGAPEE